MHVACAVDRVVYDAVAALEGPAMLGHVPMDDGDGDHFLQPFQRAEDQRPMRPGAGEGDIEMIAARFGLKAGLAARPRGAVLGDPAAELRRRPFEPAAGRLRVVPLIHPLAVLQQSHRALSFRRRALGWRGV